MYGLAFNLLLFDKRKMFLLNISCIFFQIVVPLQAQTDNNNERENKIYQDAWGGK